jgi:large subunit ribosomal protein L13
VARIRQAYSKLASIATDPVAYGRVPARSEARSAALLFAGMVAAGARPAVFLVAGPCTELARWSRCSPVPTLKTYVAKPSTRERNWLLVDASGKTLGRLATQIADTLRGKTKPEYTPHIDTGDFVIVVNAEKIHVTGDKRQQKLYHRHSGYPGGLRTRTLAEMLSRRPEEVIRRAVKGMLPRNRLGRQQLLKLKVYAGPDHPHEAQKPTSFENPG